MTPSAPVAADNDSIARRGSPARARERVGRHCGRIVRQVASVRRLSGTSCQLAGRGARPRPSKDTPAQDRLSSLYSLNACCLNAKGRLQVGGTAVILDDCNFEVQQFRWPPSWALHLSRAIASERRSGPDCAGAASDACV